MKKKLIPVYIFIFISACRPTVLLQEGKTKFYQEKKINKIAVIALPGELLDVRTFENALTSKMKPFRIEVIQGYKLFEGQTEIPGDANEVRNAIKEKGYDGMLEVKLVSIRQVETTSQDNLTRREYRIMDVANYGKLIQEYDKREESGATFQDTKVKMDVRLYDLTQSEPQVIWSSRTETSNPKTVKHIANGMSSKAVSSMKKQNALGSN